VFVHGFEKVGDWAHHLTLALVEQNRLAIMIELDEQLCIDSVNFNMDIGCKLNVREEVIRSDLIQDDGDLGVMCGIKAVLEL